MKSLDRFRAKLVIKILYAGSFNELKRFINTAVRSLKKNNLDGNHITGFIDKIIHQLEFIISATSDVLKLENITRAKDFLIQTKQEVNELAV